MNIIWLRVELMMFKWRDVLQMLEDVVIDFTQIGLMFFWKVEGEIHNDDINRCVWESDVGLSVEGAKLFVRGFYRVKFTIIHSHREDNDFCVRIHGRFFADFAEVIKLGPRVTVNLNVLLSLWGNTVKVRVAKEQDRGISLKNPILDFPGFSSAVVDGSQSFLRRRCCGRHTLSTKSRIKIDRGGFRWSQSG